jgi:hypothetical protein
MKYSLVVCACSFACVSLSSLPVFAQKKIKPELLGVVQTKKITEASGLAASIALPGYYWTHNDSGGQPEVYLLSSKAKLKSTIKLDGVINRDWEDIAEGVGPTPKKQYVYVGDIGNNVKLGLDIAVYRFAAPTQMPAEKADIKPDRLFLQYPDGARDAETLMIDPIFKSIYIISKREKQVGIYKTKLLFKDGEEAKLQKVGVLPYTWITAGDISQDGLNIIIRDKDNVYYWRRSPNETVEAAMAKPATILPCAKEKQGEGLTFSVGNTGYLTISEGEHSPMYFYPKQF